MPRVVRVIIRIESLHLHNISIAEDSAIGACYGSCTWKNHKTSSLQCVSLRKNFA